MPLTITADLITSDRTTHTARLVPARPAGREAIGP
jgi:hypothetical protein